MAKEEVDKSNKEKNAPKNKEKALTKVVVRRLPPLMTEDVFLEQIAPLAEHDYFHFVKADSNLGNFAFSRAYINFLNVDDLFIFRDKFDGYVFLDNKGNEFLAVVEFATSQKIPRKTSETDPKCGTIEQDAEYVQFLKALESPEPVHLPSAESYLEEIEARERERRAQNEAIVSTPLVEFLKQKKVERTRLRDERREEKRRKDIERRRQRDEERFKRRNEKKEDNKPVVVQLLKNPDRDKDKDKQEPSASSKASEQRPLPRKELAEKKEVREKPHKEKNANSKFRDKRERETNKKPVRKDGKEGKDERLVKKSSEGSAVEEKPKEKPKKLDKDLKPKHIEEREEPPKSVKSIATKTKGEGQEVTPPSEKTLSAPKREESTAGEAEQEKKKDETEDRKTKPDRKVRNKDRPAMQIYQPRLRLAIKEGSSTSGGGSGATSPSPPATHGAGSQGTSQAEEGEGDKKPEMRTRTFKRTSVQKE